MKKIIYIAGVMMGLFLTSCEDGLEAPAKSTLDESTIFSNYDLAKGAVDGIKEPFGQTNSYRGRFLPWYGMNTDIEWYNSSTSGNDNSDLVTYDAKPNNSNMNSANNAWAMMYSGIERANLCINGLRTYGDAVPGTDMGYLLGEALTLRAIYYADLMKAWGDVVARFEPINTSTLYLPKSNRDIIYKQLLDDLAEASELVPWPNESSLTGTVEQVNKAFVKGFRARLALVAGGYSQYPDGVRLSTDPDLSRDKMYALALQECKDVIASGTTQLEGSFEELWRKYNRDEINAGGESLWEIPFSSGRGRWLFTFAVRHRSVDQYTGQARGGQGGPTPFMFYEYDPSDLRQDVTCVPYEWGDADKDTKIAQQQLTGIDSWAFGKFRYEWKDSYVTSSNDDGTNFMYMRYAEVVLMAAEAANELEGPGSAAPYLRMLRERAFDPADWSTMVDGYINGLGSKEEMFQAIVKEHKLEFCGEMLRKQALIRWNLLGDKLEEAKAKMYDLRNTTGEYSDVPQTVYYEIGEDGESLVTYGIERGETDNRSADFAYSMDWATPDEIEDEKIETLYTFDPDQHQFWPIWQVFLDASNGQLKNDYGY
ncbi:RagB/SusD family nutrient uptake outer membrane protein [Fulvivirga ligni]|uniref:RagB/SusD family nutrient uptake outer membrane protein n=1 Tax=Fulvivirga ligni TaxID=2904246 RepID=UPI001F458BF1|nr:RagB/SusD family nutrient uptake outer membrane protein [Fulvivirga ligni]UII23406.1 RagB/SusD family nutrient uptake outer membrane protein [Fulvivirga ligni]